MAERQIPGGAYHNEQGTTREAQIPGAQYVNEVTAADVGGGSILLQMLQHGLFVGGNAYSY